ncbi:sigma factor-like helix-turn-helix DNA-binding protein [Streptomyces bauhiniae]
MAYPGAERTPGDSPPREPRPDGGLLTARAAEGDEEAFAVLVREHAPAPVGLVTRLADDLSAQHRICWVLRELDGRSYEFIAETVGISQEAVPARVFRARRCPTRALGAWR